MKRIACIVTISDAGKISAGEASDSISALVPKAQALAKAGAVGRTKIANVAVLSNFKSPIMYVAQSATNKE